MVPSDFYPFAYLRKNFSAGGKRFASNEKDIGKVNAFFEAITINGSSRKVGKEFKYNYSSTLQGAYVDGKKFIRPETLLSMCK